MMDEIKNVKDFLKTDMEDFDLILAVNAFYKEKRSKLSFEKLYCGFDFKFVNERIDSPLRKIFRRCNLSEIRKLSSNLLFFLSLNDVFMEMEWEKLLYLVEESFQKNINHINKKEFIEKCLEKGYRVNVKTGKIIIIDNLNKLRISFDSDKDNVLLFGKGVVKKNV